MKTLNPQVRIRKSELPEKSRRHTPKYCQILTQFLASGEECAILLNIENTYNAYHGLYVNIRKHKYPVKVSCRCDNIFLRRIREYEQL